jgi:hypothetical protein
MSHGGREHKRSQVCQTAPAGLRIDTMKEPPSATPPRRPEHWKTLAGDGPIARLDIPADAQHERTFEISCAMNVRPNENAAAPWHELRVYADGELQWSRRVATQHPAAFDGLEYRFRRRVAVGRALRLQAMVDCSEARRWQLVIEADEA